MQHQIGCTERGIEERLKRLRKIAQAEIDLTSPFSIGCSSKCEALHLEERVKRSTTDTPTASNGEQSSNSAPKNGKAKKTVATDTEDDAAGETTATE